MAELFLKTSWTSSIPLDRFWFGSWKKHFSLCMNGRGNLSATKSKDSCSPTTVVWGIIERVVSVYISKYLLLLYPLLVKLILPSKISVLKRFAVVAPPCIARLLLKLVVLVKVSKYNIVICVDCTTSRTCWVMTKCITNEIHWCACNCKDCTTIDCC